MRQIIFLLTLLTVISIGCRDACCQEPIPATEPTWCCDGCRAKFADQERRIKALEERLGLSKRPTPAKVVLDVRAGFAAASEAATRMPPAQAGSYPVRGRWWTGCSNWHHLTTGEHAGMFDAVWLASLTWEELQSVHADAHEGTVNWTYAKKPPIMRSLPPRHSGVIIQSCPNGQCPLQRR